MDLRGISNSISNTVNPNVIGVVRRCTGYTIDPATRKQVPSYAADVTGPIQIQALTIKDIRFLDGINVQGAQKTAFLRGSLSGVLRPEGHGADLIIVGGETWKVLAVIERWPTWTSAAVQLQGGV